MLIASALTLLPKLEVAVAGSADAAGVAVAGSVETARTKAGSVEAAGAAGSVEAAGVARCVEALWSCQIVAPPRCMCLHTLDWLLAFHNSRTAALWSGQRLPLGEVTQ